MKMKKLLAGVLSATMVATMIPASMAFGVSATAEDSLVASYDLTTEEGRQGWFVGGTNTTPATIDENGVTFIGGIAGASQRYIIANPLNGEGTNGFSVALDVTTSGDQVNVWESMFNFGGVNKDSNTDGYFSVSGNGGGVHLNDWLGNYWDYTTGESMDLSTEKRVVLTVTADNVVSLYCNGALINSFDADEIGKTGTPSSIVSYVDNMAYFNLGAARGNWGQPNMTVSAVSFYNSALLGSEVSDLGNADAAMPTVTPTPEGEADITSGLISAYEFEGDLTNSVNGAGDATLVGYQLGATTATSASFEDGAVVLTPGTGTDAYGLKLDVDTSKISANTFTVSFNVNYASLALNAAGIFVGAANQASESWYSIGTFDDEGENNTFFYRIWNNGGGMSYNQLLADQTSNLNEYANVTAVFDGTFATLYVNGTAVVSDEVSYVVKDDTGFYLGANCWDAIPDITVDSAYVYNRALSANDVEMLYAKSIADSLYITMRGRQAGTINGETAVRFVANLDQDAINDNEAVTKLGWAAEDGTAVTENATGYMLNTVTSDSNLAAAGKYAYTYVQATENSVAVLPCVQITVNGNDYWFAYDGISGNATSTDKSAVVSAIDVEGIFTAAAENTLA